MKIKKFRSFRSDKASRKANGFFLLAIGGVLGSVKQNRPMINDVTPANTRRSLPPSQF